MKFSNLKSLDVMNRDFRLQEGIKEEGIEDGLKKGHKKAMQDFATNLLNMNVDITIIVQSTGLSIEQINTIFQQLKNKLSKE